MNSEFGNYRSRISVRATTAGVLTTFASLSLLMSLAAGFGLWGFDLNAMSQLGAGFGVFSVFAWALSVAAGAFVSTMASRSQNRVDGMLNGVVTWASACVVGCLAMVIIHRSFFADHSMASQSSPELFWFAFIADSLALGGALGAGTLAARTKQGIVRSSEFGGQKRAA